jgi:hypothetical protein
MEPIVDPLLAMTDARKREIMTKMEAIEAKWKIDARKRETRTKMEAEKRKMEVQEQKINIKIEVENFS